MKRFCVVIVALITVFAAGTAVAGDKGPCTGDPDECLKKMQAKIAAKGWLGVETAEAEVGYFTVSEVFENSPAQAAGFQKGDVVLAINGVKCTEENAKAALKKTEMKPGSEATYIVKRGDQKVKIAVTLGHVPEKVAKMWIAEHMEHHHDTKMASK